ncbi:heat shock protein 70 family [Endogone sp. FLAS-F59071]|nr:heat shock protein 70 family [Endogone sp. FLAS-F59071]|eukprot:RUS21101.1 heat shock protein 70 family [Endogone sp. FLAS-F59071]
MSVVGLDIGNLQSVIAVARNRGIDVICNEVSNRATPTLASFGPKQRYIGEAAKSQEISNFKNTVGSFKRLAGRTFQDPEVHEIEKQYINAELIDVDGQVGVKVEYLGQETKFSNVQLLAMYFTKLKEVTQNEIKIPISDVVISVPGWFTDIQRRAILDAAEIASLNPLRLINDTTAAALGYGITKTDLPEEKPRHVVFCDIGHSSYSVAVVAFIKGQLSIKSTAFDRHFGGRNFDQVIVDHLAEEFKAKKNIDVFSNNKAIFRLRSAAEKLKKVLSANPQSPINIESIMNDIDVSAIVTRSDFEEWAKDTLDRIEFPLQEAMKKSGLNLEDIDAIEMIGGSTRIPIIKERISKFFGKEVSTTLNQDEAVARGAALQCAILSPVFKVRDFRVNDAASYPIKITWLPTPEEQETEIIVFDRGNTIPSTKVLTFYRKEPFDLEARYADPSAIPRGINPWIGRYSVKNVEPGPTGDASQVKVKARLNVHSVMSIEGAYVVEEKVEEVKVEETGPAPMDTDDKTAAAASAEPPKTKKKLVKKADLPVNSGTTSLDKSIINRLREQENEMSSTDRLVADTEERKNALEEYVYDTRSKMEVQYSEFVDPIVRETFIVQLNAAEEWLYGEGEDALKSAYVGKLEELRNIGVPVAERYKDFEERPRAERLLRESIELFQANALSSEEKFAHISVDDKQQVVDRCDKARRWLDEQLAKQEKIPKTENPVVTAKDILKERESLVHFCSPLLSKPKPAPKPTEAPKPEEAAKPDDNKPEEKKDEKEETEEKAEMDID